MHGGARNERGAAALEFALVAPILIVLVMGIVNFGIFFAQSLSLNNAAREGARFGAVRGHDCAEIHGVVDDSSPSLAMPASSVTTTVSGNCGAADGPCTGSVDGAQVVVTTAHTYVLIVPMPIPGFPSSFNVKGHGEFRCEYS
jgi:Flp pilus assembly protein TadG